jgi:hypothetical protein
VLTSYKGKMMRINPDGTIPTDNPFYNQTTGIQQAIFAYGFRNSFSFAIQPGTGRIFANDVGTNVWEEVNDVVAGGNYGYPEVEGPTNDPRFVSPVYSYQHSPGCAIVGGDFYNPATATFPADYVGDYFFGDLCDRTITRLDPDTHEATVFAQFTRGRIVDIDTAPDGSLYYLLRPLEGIYPGGIFKASFNSTSPGAPAISEQPQNKVGSLGQPVTFSVAASGNEPLNYQWQRNGVNILGATQPNFTLPAVAQADDGAQFRVVVTNAVGSVTSSAATLSVTTNQPPVPTITLPAAGATFSAGDTINFAGDATDAEDGVLPASAFTWRVDLYHADTPETQHAHPVLAPTTGSKSGSVVADLAGHYETTIWMRVTLTVKDSAGLEATTFADVQPNKVTMTLGTSAPGLRLDLDGTPVRTPAPVPAVVGVPRLLGAPATQTVNGVTYQFDGWSDAGAAEHPVNVPATDATYTANYHALDDGSANPPDSPDLTIAFAQPIAESALAGTTAKTKVKLTNAGATPLSGAAGVGLFLSPDEFLDPEDPAVATLPKNLVIKPGKSKTISVPFTIPDTIVAGSYRLLAWADPGKAVAEKNEANNVAVSGAIAVGPATRDFSVAVNAVTLNPGPAKRGLATLLLHYDGNVPANGPLGIELRASADTTPDGSDALVATITRKVKLKPGASKLLKVKFPATSLAAGAYYLTAAVDTVNAFAESNEANNTAVSGTTFTVA